MHSQSKIHQQNEPLTNLIACQRPWCGRLVDRLQKKTTSTFQLITDTALLNLNYLEQLAPEYIFFPHWSNIIPAAIYENFQCVIFHMTDLPYGRGGSPLQNLIVQGHQQTVLSAIQCVRELDAGPIYLKWPLSLLGNAEEIYIRANELIEEMIVEILKEKPVARQQVGEVVHFKRRKPEREIGQQSKVWRKSMTYSNVRCRGYPSAFVKVGPFRLEFSRASRKTNHIHADVKIIDEREQ